MKIAIISLLYFLTRIPFIRNYPYLFDSFEYIDRIQNATLSNIREIISSSHQPIHTFYFFWLFILKNILFFLDTHLLIIINSLLFGFLSVLVWYKFVSQFRNQSISFYSTLLILSFPLFFISNINIMYESELVFLQVLALYLVYLSTKNNSLVKTIFAGISWGLSQSIFIGSLFLYPIYMALYFFYGRKNKILHPFVLLVSSVTTSILLDISSFNKFVLIREKYVSYFSLPNYDQNTNILLFLLRLARNFTFQPFMMLSVSGSIFFLISLIFIFLKNKKVFAFYLLFLSPFFFLMQFWGAWLIGRISMFFIFPASLAISSCFRKKFLRILILIFIFTTTAYYMIKQKDFPPLYKYHSLIENIYADKKTAVLTSDYNRFLYEKNRIPIYKYVGFRETAEDETRFVETYLRQGYMVLIDSAGLRFPYFQFDSDFFQILSMGKIGYSQGSKLLTEFDFRLYAQDQSNKDIYFFEIVGRRKDKKNVQTKIFYPDSFYYISKNKPYKYDPLANFFYLVLGKKDPEFWWYE